MDASERERLFERALSDYRGGRFVLACSALRRLTEIGGSQDPAHLSYFGLLVALTEKNRQKAVSLCERAIEKDGRRSSLLYVNLSRALTVFGSRREAIDALSRGLLLHPNDRRLRRERQRLVPRARPTFSSLPRHHRINKVLGIARTLGRRVWVSLSPGREL
jgi:tetratricopeptide (TPR) repeat protein